MKYALMYDIILTVRSILAKMKAEFIFIQQKVKI